MSRVLQKGIRALSELTAPPRVSGVFNCISQKHLDGQTALFRLQAGKGAQRSVASHVLLAQAPNTDLLAFKSLTWGD